MEFNVGKQIKSYWNKFIGLTDANNEEFELYSNSAQKTDIISSKDPFFKLVNFEKGHKEILEAALYYLGQEGFWHGYSPPR